ncbi:hypothetical protein VP1G_02127 [Cytospora mali]|uniref:Uncharacterized protein n=1 Tax=Cytospora mali TaxID=578113 RepID=A0A194USQ4_CYTMA|nr:hypothetical protein VP1G_02127 [Valsa mali var. pyri (nom. inval.)]
MRFSVAASLVALLEMGASLPTANPTSHNALLNDTATDLTAHNTDWTKLVNPSTFGLLHRFGDAVPGLDLDLDRDLDLNLDLSVELDAEDRMIEARGGPAPRSRKVAEQMKGLPECFQTCFRNENGKVGVDIYSWDLNKFCNMPTWVRTNTWILYHIYPCWKKECRNHMDEIKGVGRQLMVETCPR